MHPNVSESRQERRDNSIVRNTGDLVAHLTEVLDELSERFLKSLANGAHVIDSEGPVVCALKLAMNAS